MFCAKCGAELKEGAKFCAKCGEPVLRAEMPAAGGTVQAAQAETSAAEKAVQAAQAETSAAGKTAPETQPETSASGGAVPGTQAETFAPVGQPVSPEQGQPVPQKKKPGGRKVPVVPLAAGGVMLALLIALAIIFFPRSSEDIPTGGGKTGSAGRGSATQEAKDIKQEAAGGAQDWRELTPLYTIDDVPVIDIYARNYTPAQKAPGITWDKTLFYWLEDIDQGSTQDGYLAQCDITKMLMRRADTGALVEYEIYRDPSDGTVYKVVSIEDMGDHMDLVDYYYQQGGAPNFTFTRQDSVYTPTYATPAKTGSRYYFNNDVMARWRMITVPNEIGEYVLAPNGASYSQADYYAESAELQAVYDETESRELNAARNTYDAVAAAGEGIGLVEGRVTDTAGNPAAGKTVDIVRTADGVLLYRTVTGEDGSFCIFVHLEETECEVIVREDDTFRANSVRGALLSKSGGGSSLGNILLHRLDGDEYPVHINVYPAAEVRTGEDGSLLRELLPGAKVALRAGAGAKTGEPLQTLEADAEGKIETTLPSGTYTAQIDVAGYATVYVTVEVAEQETTAEGYLLPAVPEGQTGIVLTWEGEADLDLTLFTPYQSTGGDMAHIGGSIASDGNGNSLVADNASGCEVMYVNTAVAGSYKLYVNDYTESSAGNYSSDQLSRLNIHIYIYDSTGLIAELIFPAGQTGVVWEAADLNGGRVTPGQRVYTSLEGKNWWTGSKWELNLEECPALTELMWDMTVAAESFEWGANYRHWIDADTAQSWYSGNWENLGSLVATIVLHGNMEMEGYVQDNIEDVTAKYWGDGSVGYYKRVTEEQMEYLVYAATGTHWDLESLNQVLNSRASYVTDPGAQMEGNGIVFTSSVGGLETWTDIKNLVSEYAGAGQWKVRAECMYGGEYIPTVKLADITFTVTRNPDSCFDGYSITGVEVTPTDNSGWAKAYADKLKELNAQNGLDGALGYGVNCSLIYLDGDSVPELVYNNHSFDLIIYAYNGQIYQIGGDGYDFPYGTHGWAYSYAPYTGFLREQCYDGAGEIRYYMYDRVNDNYEIEGLFEYSETYFIDANGNGYCDEGDTILEWEDPIPKIYDSGMRTYVPCTEQELQEKLTSLGIADLQWIDLIELTFSEGMSPDEMIWTLAKYQ